MFKATIKSLLGHKLRLALTALSVVLGVSFVAGTFVLTDTINHTFDNLFAEISEGVDVTVRARSGYGEGAGVDVSRDTMPDSVLAMVRQTPGVALAEGTVGGYAQLVDAGGDAIGSGQAPTLGFNWTDPELSPLELRSGRPPERDGEVVIDAVVSRKEKLGLNQKVKVLFRTGTGELTIVGVAGFGEADNLAGATLAIFETRTAQRVFAKVGQLDSIEVKAAEGVAPLELQARLNDVLPDTVEAIPGDQVADESSESVKEGLSFFSTALLTFAAISLFVGAFIIFNTFSILVAQRTRELALLRALGASRRQVTVSVLTEAAIVGLVSSLAGLGLGVLVAIGLQGLLNAFGIDLPTTTTQFLPRTVIASLIAGLGVTVVASIAPSRRASRVPPMAALRADAGVPTGSLRRRTVVGASIVVVGVATLLFGLFGNSGSELELAGLGALLTFLGVAVVSPVVARPLAGVIGAPLPRLFGVSGKLGRQNAMRNPRRTAATAAALMIGLGLVGCVTVMASSIKESTTAIFDRSLAADFAVTTESFVPTISPAVAEQLRQQPELAAVTGLQQGEFRLNGESTKFLTGGDPEALPQVLNVDVLTGDYASLGRGELLIEEREAKDKKWTVGTTVRMQFSRTGDQEMRVGAIYGRNELLGRYLISTETFDRNFTDRLDFIVLVKAAPGVPPAAARAAIERVTADFPNVEVKDQTQVRADQEAQVNQLLGLVSALLGLAIVIALMGIVNTLALSVFERTRELGLLRAVGMSRRQVRGMVRAQSVITAVLGALLGLAVGVLFGWALVRALDSQGVTELVIPGGQLVFYVILAAIAGIIAAVGPARRAARLDVLQAIGHE